MTEEKKKTKTALEAINEILQWFFFGAMLFKKGGQMPNTPDGKPDIQVPRVPDWIISKFHFLTTEDEEEYVQLVDQAEKNTSEQKRFFKFKDKLVNEGWDEDFLRRMLVNMHRNYLDRKDAKKTEIPDSPTEFIKQVIGLDKKHSRPYVSQRELARQKKLLKKVGPMKKLFVLAHAHKLQTLVVLIITPFFLLAVAYQTLNLLLG